MWLLYEDFICLLREQFQRWPWWILPNGEIRTERDDGEELDPLTALYATIHHRFVDIGSYHIAARYLGIDRDEADVIVAACDLSGSYNAHVRADLIDALRLEEQWGRQGRWEDRAYFAHPYPHGYDRPFRRGYGSAGIASAARWRAPSKFTSAPARAEWRWKLIASIEPPVDAVSISCGSGDLPLADSSSFSVGLSRPGFALYHERCAAD